jgi:antitoxin component YwqK of YwqJK toxin-antitoxin module
MKLYLKVIIIFFLALQSCSQKETNLNELQFRNDKYYEINQDKLFTGIGLEKYPNEQLKTKMPFKKGLKHGECESYLENGQVVETFEYKNNLLHDKYSVYFNDGTLQKKEFYNKGELDGEYTEYFPNTNLFKKGNYEKGVKTGEWIEYYENGNIANKIKYSNDVEYGMYEKYYNNGNISEKGIYVLGNLDGENTLFYYNGNIKEEGNYSNGKKIGEWILYNEDGSKVQKLSDYLVGKWEAVEEGARNSTYIFKSDNTFEEWSVSCTGMFKLKRKGTWNVAPNNKSLSFNTTYSCSGNRNIKYSLKGFDVTILNDNLFRRSLFGKTKRVYSFKRVG